MARGFLTLYLAEHGCSINISLGGYFVPIQLDEDVKASLGKLGNQAHGVTH